MKIPEPINRMPALCAFSRFKRQDSGAILIEFSITIVCWCVTIFTLLEMCSAVYAYTVLADAAHEGVHYAVLNPRDNSGAQDTVKRYASNTLHDISAIDVSVSYPDGVDSPPARVAVDVSYQYLPYLSFVMKDPPAMHAYAEGRLVR